MKLVPVTSTLNPNRKLEHHSFSSYTYILRTVVQTLKCMSQEQCFTSYQGRYPSADVNKRLINLYIVIPHVTPLITPSVPKPSRRHVFHFKVLPHYEGQHLD